MRRRRCAVVASTCCSLLLGLAGPPAAATAQGPRLGAIAGFSCVPSVEGPMPTSATSRPFQALLMPPLPRGWIDQEFFVSCSSPAITYKTSVYVRRPVNAHRASGHVVVEPLHSGDLFGMLTNVQPYLVAHGDVHVGVAANSDAVDRLVKPANPSRYATLDVPATAAIENEILAGVGALLHERSSPLLRDVRVRDAVLGGWSQTTIQVRDFMAAQSGTARVDGRRVYDGYYPAQAAVGSTLVAPVPDVGVPVIELEGERELLETVRRFATIGYRRPDSATYRLYEVPGMAHVTSEPDDPVSSFSRALQCDRPSGAVQSDFKQTQVWEMALDNLMTWISRGLPAPHAPRIEVAADGTTVVRDVNGNARGGVRTTVVDVPTATIVPTSLNPGGVPGNPCAYIGYQLDFSTQKLEELYGTHRQYTAQVAKDARSLVRGRWLLPDSARHDIVEAARSDVLRGSDEIPVRASRRPLDQR